jgi:hypothetical protein
VIGELAPSMVLICRDLPYYDASINESGFQFTVVRSVRLPPSRATAKTLRFGGPP